jgi:hypothetical protein
MRHREPQLQAVVDRRVDTERMMREAGLTDIGLEPKPEYVRATFRQVRDRSDHRLRAWLQELAVSA